MSGNFVGLLVSDQTLSLAIVGKEVLAIIFLLGKFVIAAVGAGIFCAADEDDTPATVLPSVHWTSSAKVQILSTESKSSPSPQSYWLPMMPSSHQKYCEQLGLATKCRPRVSKC